MPLIRDSPHYLHLTDHGDSTFCILAAWIRTDLIRLKVLVYELGDLTRPISDWKAVGGFAA